MKRVEIGRAGEQLAANYLISLGYQILETNFFNRRGYRIGELDIIARSPEGILIFVEVKSLRGNPQWTVPEMNLTSEKLKKIFKSVNLYLRKNDLLEEKWRVDLITVVFDFFRKKATLRQIKAIYQD